MDYNKITLWNFINNKETPTNIYDYNFYIDAINIANDKDIYFKSPKEIKTNYQFVLFLLEKFYEDKKFINEVAQFYLNNINKKDYSYQELIFIMSDFIPIYDEEYNNKYEIEKNKIYQDKRKSIEDFLKEEQYDEEYGMGFFLLLFQEKSKIIVDYFANKFLEEIFYTMDNLTLEDIIHMNFSKKEDFIKHGIDNYIIEYVDLFDKDLANYLEDDPFIYIDIKMEIERIIENWNNYIDKKFSPKIALLKTKINEIIKKYKSTLSSKQIHKYINNNNIIPIDLPEDENYTINSTLININDCKCIKESLDLVERLFANNNQNKEEKKQNNNKVKILKFTLPTNNKKS